MQSPVEQASDDDVTEAVRCLCDSFANDPLIRYLFHTHPGGMREASAGFFSLLLRVRIKLQMPAVILRDGNSIIGCAMGYDTCPPDWPGTFGREWSQLLDSTPGLQARLDTYEAIGARFRPADPHYYLGVIGIHPVAQGIGAGRRLLDGFCLLSANDPASDGVYLETASQASLRFYVRCGFSLLGEGSLNGEALWCVYLEHSRRGPRETRDSGA